MRDWAPDVVGVTAFTVQLVDVHKTIRAAKAGTRYAVVDPHVNDFRRNVSTRWRGCT